MNLEYPPRSIDSLGQIAWVLWGAFVAAMLVYAVVPQFVALPGEPVAGLGSIFWLLGASLAVSAILYRRWAFSDATLQRGVKPREPRDRGRTAEPPATRPSTPTGASSEEGLLAVAQAALRHQIVLLALIESIAILGLVQGLLSRDGTQALPFVAAAVALALLALPRVREAVERARTSAWSRR